MLHLLRTAWGQVQHIAVQCGFSRSILTSGSSGSTGGDFLLIIQLRKNFPQAATAVQGQERTFTVNRRSALRQEFSKICVATKSDQSSRFTSTQRRKRWH